MLLHEKLAPYELILASQSPRRRQLLSDSGLDYTLADPYEVEEVFPAGLPAGEVPVYLSQLKSKLYPYPLPENGILVTADTVVVVGNRITGKPGSREEAIEMLENLSGKSHKVITGVTLRTPERERSFASESLVTFRKLRTEEIEYYVDNYGPYDKAGGYGIQEWIGYVGIEHIEGSFYNVMGLPIQKLYTELEKFI